MATFHLTMRSGPTVGKTFPLDANEITIGRDAANGISINDSEISRKHARILKEGEVYMVEDLGSTNGTFVNGARLSGMMVIKIGDLIAMGETVSLYCEADFDPDATVMSAKAAMPAPAPRPVAPQAAPVPAPLPAPVVVPEPAPDYTGEMPENPEFPKKSNRKVLLIIIAALIVICICAVALLAWFAPCEWWLVLPFVKGSC